MTTPTIWYRIDCGDGTITVAAGVTVLRATQAYYSAPPDVIAGGRFRTPAAIYSREDQLTASEAATLDLRKP